MEAGIQQLTDQSAQKDNEILRLSQANQDFANEIRGLNQVFDDETSKLKEQLVEAKRVIDTRGENIASNESRILQLQTAIQDLTSKNNTMTLEYNQL